MKVTEQVELKHIQRLLNEASTSLKLLESERGVVDRKIQQQKSIIENLKKKLSSFNNTDGLVISEHAIIRYLERVYKFDVENMKKEIAPDYLIQSVVKLGNSGVFPVKDTHKVRIRNGIVVTVLTKDEEE